MLLLIACNPVDLATPTATVTAVSSATAHPIPTATKTTVPTSLPTATVTPVPTTATPISPTNFFTDETDAPAPTTQIETGQTIWFARGNAIWRTDLNGLNTERISSDQFLGRDTDEVDYRDTQPKLSPNGRFVAQLFDYKSTRLLDLGTGNEIILPGMWEFDWSPDSRFLAYVPTSRQSSNQPIIVYDVHRGQNITLVEQIRGQDDIVFFNLVWSPDGTHLAYACCFDSTEPYDGSSTGEIQKVTVATAERISVAEAVFTVAGGASPVCWHEGYVVNTERENARRCNSNSTHNLFSATSPNNLHAIWQSVNDANEDWIATQIIVSDATSDTEVWTFDWNTATPLALAWSLDGRFLFFSDTSDNGSIWRLQADGTDLQEFIPNAQLLGVIEQWQRASTTIE